MNVQIENYSNIKSIRNYYIEPNLNREDKITITKRKGEHFKIKVIVQLRNNFFLCSCMYQYFKIYLSIHDP